VVALTTPGAEDAALPALALGALDYLVKPVSPQRLATTLSVTLARTGLQQAAARAERRQAGLPDFGDLIGKDPLLLKALAGARKVSRSTLPVLIEGETGTGKTLLAQAIHANSECAGAALVCVNGTELTGADGVRRLFGAIEGGKRCPGRAQDATRGTLVIDEVGQLHADAQVELVRWLETGSVRLAGANRTERLETRLIATSTHRLMHLVRTGQLREDLYYRLAVAPLFLSPLRDRREDIGALAQAGLAQFAADGGRHGMELDVSVLPLLRAGPWPGNVRQLLRLLHRAVTLSPSTVVGPHMFPALGSRPLPLGLDEPPVPRSAPDAERFLAPSGELRALSDIERDLIVFALARHKGRMAQVARSLKIGRSTLYRKLREYGLEDGQSDAA